MHANICWREHCEWCSEYHTLTRMWRKGEEMKKWRYGRGRNESSESLIAFGSKSCVFLNSFFFFFFFYRVNLSSWIQQIANNNNDNTIICYCTTGLWGIIRLNPTVRGISMVNIFISAALYLNNIDYMIEVIIPNHQHSHLCQRGNVYMIKVH